MIILITTICDRSDRLQTRRIDGCSLLLPVRTYGGGFSLSLNGIRFIHISNTFSLLRNQALQALHPESDEDPVRVAETAQ